MGFDAAAVLRAEASAPVTYTGQDLDDVILVVSNFETCRYHTNEQAAHLIEAWHMLCEADCDGPPDPCSDAELLAMRIDPARIVATAARISRGRSLLHTWRLRRATGNHPVIVEAGLAHRGWRDDAGLIDLSEPYWNRAIQMWTGRALALRTSAVDDTPDEDPDIAYELARDAQDAIDHPTPDDVPDDAPAF